MKTLTRQQKDFQFSLLLLVPAFFIIFGIMLFPLLKGVYYSFFDYKIMTFKNPAWNNFENYKAIFRDGEVLNYLGVTLSFVIFVVIFNTIFGIILASMINHRVLDPVRSVVSGLFLLPWIVPQIVVAVTFSWMFQPQYGIVNFILKSLGLIDYDLAWLSTRGYAFTAVITAIIWKQLPISITMILAGLQSVPVTLIEAAKMEGASAYRLYISVILPYLKAVIATVMLITIIDNFQLFTTIWVMTSGGPLSSTSTLSIGAYREAFEFFDLGKGQAIGVIWMIILSGFVILYNRNLLKNEIH